MSHYELFITIYAVTLSLGCVWKIVLAERQDDMMRHLISRVADEQSRTDKAIRRQFSLERELRDIKQRHEL